VKWFRRGLVFKAHILLYRSTLGLRVIKKKRREEQEETVQIKHTKKITRNNLIEKAVAFDGGQL
jgi:hypothetical protein